MRLDTILRREINRGIKDLKEKGEGDYILAVGKRTNQMLEEEALKHSLEIEFPKALERNENRDCSKMFRKSDVLEEELGYLENAWSIAKKYNQITEDLIKKVNARVEGSSGKNNYRKKDIDIKGSSIIPPRHEKIKDKMNELISEYEHRKNIAENKKEDEDDSASYIEVASYFHMRLGHIHPFHDGNGRTARILQNRILEMGDLPPAIINSAERNLYMDKINEAQEEWKLKEGEPGKKQHEFCNYIGSKVNNAIDRMRNDHTQ